MIPKKTRDRLEANEPIENLESPINLNSNNNINNRKKEKQLNYGFYKININRTCNVIGLWLVRNYEWDVLFWEPTIFSEKN